MTTKREPEAKNTFSIIGYYEMPPDALEPHPLTRSGRIRSYEGTDLHDSIRKHGILKPVDAVKHNGGFQVIDGCGRLIIARALGMDRIPVMVVDAVVTEELIRVINYQDRMH